MSSLTELDGALLGLVTGLGTAADRCVAARRLAEALGGEELLILIKDSELDVLLPAPGFPQTLPAGPEWPAFLQSRPVFDAGSRNLPSLVTTGRVDAWGSHAEDGSLLVLLGGAPRRPAADMVLILLPVLARAFQAEQATMAAAAHAMAARDAAAQSRKLAGSLAAARRRLQQELQETQQADRRKTEFLAMLAHELRNPLAPILNAVRWLQEKQWEDPTLATNHSIIERQANHLVRLVDDLLDMARITRGAIELQPAPHTIEAMVAQAIETSWPLIDERGHELLISMPEQTIWAPGDRSRMAQVVANLLCNAAKYTDSGGEIRLAVEKKGELAQISVQDTGRGIPDEMLPHIFDLFTQLNPSLDRSHGGLGIGLALVKSLVEMHGGEVRASSEGPGRGSRFEVDIPLLPASEIPRERPTQAAVDPAKVARRIVVVDDNRDAAATLCELVELWGHQCEIFSGGAAALERVGRDPPDIVILDLGMPGIDGFEVAQRLRDDLGYHGTIIALTGYGQEDDRRRTRDAGFDAHLVKPVNPRTLAEMLVDSPAPAR